jgi:hypothetical protein
MIARIKGFRRYKNEYNQMHPPVTEHGTELITYVRLPEGVQVSKTALTFPTTFTIDEWIGFGETLSALETAVQFWVGDWWHYGWYHYGDRKKLVEKNARRLFGYSFETLMNYGWVAGNVPTSVRSEVLSWSHHVAVAPLPVEEMKGFLDKAVENKWSVKQLQRHIAEVKDDRSNDEKLDSRAMHYGMRLKYAADLWESFRFNGTVGSLDLELIEHVHWGTLVDLEKKDQSSRQVVDEDARHHCLSHGKNELR